MTDFEVTAVTHRGLGRLRRLAIGEARWDLTHDEASILSRALSAVREGRSAERTIFMSPIASDGEFTAEVVSDGVTIGSVGFSWEVVDRLAAALADPGDS